MKPRIESTSWTAEDDMIGMRLMRRRVWHWPLLALKSDRRDADLMYRLVTTRFSVEREMVETNEPFKATVQMLLEAGIEL